MKERVGIMKMEENEKKKKKIVKKAKKIRGIVMMTLLCVLMMSAATYAWFTLSNTAKIANLTMTVGDVTGLQIAEDIDGNAGTYKSSIDFPTIAGKLLPATSQDGMVFQAPDYDESGEVIKTTNTDKKLPIPGEEDDEGYYMEYSFWLKSLGKDANVRLVAGSGIAGANGIYNDTNSAGYKGTYILSKEVDSTKGVPGSAAVRISFKVDGSAKIFEPNCNFSYTGTALAEGIDFAKDSTGNSIKTADIKHDIDGSIVENDVILHLTKDTPQKVTMYIWIEGKDSECANQIAAKTIKGQLVFTNEEPTQQTP